MGRRKRKLRETHAAVRALQRYGEGVDLPAIRREVDAGRVTYLMRQTVSRSLTAVQVGETWVFLVLDRKRQGIVTVLSPEQAKTLCGSSDSTPGRTLQGLLAATESSSSTSSA